MRTQRAFFFSAAVFTLGLVAFPLLACSGSSTSCDAATKTQCCPGSCQGDTGFTDAVCTSGEWKCPSGSFSKDDCTSSGANFCMGAHASTDGGN